MSLEGEDCKIMVPEKYALGDELNWDAPWIDVDLWVELPFWLMMDNTTISVEVDGHVFPVSVHGETFELHGRWITDSKQTVGYRGPYKKIEDLTEEIQEILRESADLSVLWRKCKTSLKIETRCNKDVWDKAQGDNDGRVQVTVRHYLDELCRAHMPVVNKLIKGYRLATYDYFAFEVAPWDVPHWNIERDGAAKRCTLVPYREWDHRPMIHPAGGQPEFCRFIEGAQLRDNFTTEATPGELELLDAMNFIERGNYSEAVRRVTTAIEVVVEAVLARELLHAEGEVAAAKFIKDTRMNFYERVKKYESLSRRTLSDQFHKYLKEIRELRHEIVHKGYRISSEERGRASKYVDTGSWIFNWFENDKKRQSVREDRIAHRSIGRDLIYGIFPSRITPEGVVLTPVKI